MVRTQVYLTESEQKNMASISLQTGKKKSDLIREAIDQFIEQHPAKNRKERLRKAKGMWKDRTDLPDFKALRRELDDFQS